VCTEGESKKEGQVNITMVSETTLKTVPVYLNIGTKVNALVDDTSTNTGENTDIAGT